MLFSCFYVQLWVVAIKNAQNEGALKVSAKKIFSSFKNYALPSHVVYNHSLIYKKLASIREIYRGSKKKLVEILSKGGV